jgi:hypothetical protein
VTVWWRLAIILAVLAFQDAIVWRVRGKFDTAAQEEALKAQVAATTEKQKAMEETAAAAEVELLRERQNSAMLAKRLGTIRASKTHTHCDLDSDTLGLLKDATRSGDAPR